VLLQPSDFKWSSLIFPYASSAVLDTKINRFIRKSGVDATAHDLRATKATDLFTEGLKTEHIQKFYGHKSSVTTQLYIKEPAVVAMDRILKA
jgi:site-specific recombinase XerD